MKIKKEHKNKFEFSPNNSKKIKTASYMDTERQTNKKPHGHFYGKNHWYPEG